MVPQYSKKYEGYVYFGGLRSIWPNDEDQGVSTMLIVLVIVLVITVVLTNVSNSTRFYRFRLRHCKECQQTWEALSNQKKKSQISQISAAPLRKSVANRRGGHCPPRARKGSLRRCVMILMVAVIIVEFLNPIYSPPKPYLNPKGGREQFPRPTPQGAPGAQPCTHRCAPDTVPPVASKVDAGTTFFLFLMH